MDDLETEVLKQCQSVTTGLISEIRQGNIGKQNTIKYLIIALIVSILMLAGTNMAWLYVANQYEYVTYEQENTDGINNVNLGEIGDILNGETDSQNSCKEKQPSTD